MRRPLFECCECFSLSPSMKCCMKTGCDGFVCEMCLSKHKKRHEQQKQKKQDITNLTELRVTQQRLQ